MADFLCRNFTVLVLESCVTFLSISLYIQSNYIHGQLSLSIQPTEAALMIFNFRSWVGNPAYLCGNFNAGFGRFTA